MHVLTIIRMYLGMSQVTLAKEAGITHRDLCDMEKKKPFGRVDKYRRLASVLDLPLEPILKNDISSIPLSFFEKHPPQEYLPKPDDRSSQIGREGEDFIFAREKARLQKTLPVHAKLVLPLYKMKSQRNGWDILTYDESGRPVHLEVKTTCADGSVFSMTHKELETAQKLAAAGERYVITFITNWRKASQQVRDIPYEDFNQHYDVTVPRYTCVPKRDAQKPVTGFAHYRKQCGLTECEIAEAIGIRQHKWCLYETGNREAPVQVLLKASELMDVTVDQLLAEYPCSEV